MSDTPLPADPQVSMLIAVHNGLPYLEDALRSVMNQTLREIEIIVVDDASRDDTPAVLARLAAEDPRIRIETLKQNLRLPGALNRGLELVRAPLVARMDADDFAYPERLAVQKRFMDTHPEAAMVGTSYRQIDENGAYIRTSVRPRGDFAMRWIARFHMPITHPTIMFRADLGPGAPLRYDAQWTVSEDYDFVVRTMQRGTVICLADVLLDYRIHSASITGKNWALQNQQMSQISAGHNTFDLSPDIAAGLEPFRAAFYQQKLDDPGALFRGMRAMIAADLARGTGIDPKEQRWMWRQSAQMLLRALQRAGLGRGAILRTFALQGRDFLPALALRALEIKRVLPAALRSDPDL